MNTRLIVKIFAISVFIILAVLPIVYMYASNYSLDRYLWIHKDKRQQDIFIRTVYLGLGVAALSVLLGVTVALLVEYTNLPFRSCIAVLLIISLLIPPYITGISWLAFLGKAGDFVETQEPIPETSSMIRKNRIMTREDIAALQSRPRPPKETTIPKRPSYLPFDIDPYNVEFAIFLLSLSFFPLVFLIVSLALRNVDGGIEDAARLLYSPARVIGGVTLPLILPHILVSGLFVFIFSVSEFGVTSILRVNTLVMEIFNHFSAFFDTGQAIGLSFPLVMLIGIMILLIHILLGKRSFITISSSSHRKELIRLTTIQKIIGLGFIIVLMCLSSFIPLMVLLHQSKFMFAKAIDMAGDSFFNTIILGILSATLMVAVSFFVAYFFKRRMDPLILFPLIVPGAALGVGLTAMFNNDLTGAIYDSLLILVIGYMARFLPFTIKTLSPFFEQIHPSIEESARLGGASFPRIVDKILLPLMNPGIAIAWFVGFILCMRELSVAVMVTPPGFQTLSNRIFILYHCGEMEVVASLSLILVGMIILPAFLVVAINRLTGNTKAC